MTDKKDSHRNPYSDNVVAHSDDLCNNRWKTSSVWKTVCLPKELR